MMMSWEDSTMAASRAVRHYRLPAFLDVAKDEHRPYDIPRGVANRSGAVVDRPLHSIPCTQHRVVGQPHDLSLSQGAQRRVLHGRTGGFVVDDKDLLNRTAYRLESRPSGQRFGNAVQEGDAALRIGADHGVADACEGGPESLGFAPQLFLGPALGRDVAKAPDPSDGLVANRQ